MRTRAALAWCTVSCASATALRGQVAWQHVNTAGGPTARASHAMAMEPGGRLLLFGGRSNTSLDDTWLFDGLTWTSAQPGTRPPARGDHGLVHDLVRGRTVLFGGALFGGATGTLFMDDTWEWDGNSWLLRTPLHRPSARIRFGMVFDLPHFRTVLFGGASSTLIMDDTWQWDGVDWTQIVTAYAPPPRQGLGLAADIARGRLVLFGGFFTPAVLDDTWEYDGQVWLLRQPAIVPPARMFHGFAYDQSRQRTVMFGGTTNMFFGDMSDTWEWNGSEWQQRQPAGTPPAARRAAMTYDPHLALTVLFGGGARLLGSPLFADTFTYAATSPAGWAAYGTGCGGSAGVPAFLPVDGRAPWIGDAWGLQLALLPISAPALVVFGTSRTTWGSALLPMSLTPFGLPGCSLLASPDVSQFTVASAQVATWPIAIPNDQALLGVTMFAQGAGMDLAANAGGLVVGNALELTFGGR